MGGQWEESKRGRFLYVHDHDGNIIGTTSLDCLHCYLVTGQVHSVLVRCLVSGGLVVSTDV